MRGKVVHVNRSSDAGGSRQRFFVTSSEQDVPPPLDRHDHDDQEEDGACDHDGDLDESKVPPPGIQDVPDRPEPDWTIPVTRFFVFHEELQIGKTDD